MTGMIGLLVMMAQFQGSVVLNEIMYNPDGKTLGLDEHMEWVELINRGAEAVNLSGMMITDGGNQLYLGHFLLAPGECGVVCADEGSFRSVYGDDVCVLPWSGEWTRLRNSSDEIVLYAESGAVIESIRYEESWGAEGTIPSPADGGGASLERVDPSGLNDGSNWLPSVDFANTSDDDDAVCWGTPGAANSISTDAR